jgi:hypothetical protein
VLADVRFALVNEPLEPGTPLKRFGPHHGPAIIGEEVQPPRLFTSVEEPHVVILDAAELLKIVKADAEGGTLISVSTHSGQNSRGLVEQI